MISLTLGSIWLSRVMSLVKWSGTMLDSDIGHDPQYGFGRYFPNIEISHQQGHHLLRIPKNHLLYNLHQLVQFVLINILAQFILLEIILTFFVFNLYGQLYNMNHIGSHLIDNISNEKEDIRQIPVLYPTLRMTDEGLEYSKVAFPIFEVLVLIIHLDL